MSSPAFLLQTLFQGKCPMNSHSLESLGRLKGSSVVADTYSFTESQPFFFCAAAVPPWERGALSNEVSLGFSSADPSVDSSDR